MCPTGPWIQLSECVSERREVLPFLPECGVHIRDDAERSPVEETATESEGWSGGGVEEGRTQPGCPLQTALKVAAECDACISGLSKECKAEGDCRDAGCPPPSTRPSACCSHCIIATSCKNQPADAGNHFKEANTDLLSSSSCIVRGLQSWGKV